MFARAFLLIGSIPLALAAAEDDLSHLRTRLASLRDHPATQADLRQRQEARRALRDWIEAQLLGDRDPVWLTQHLNAALQEAGLNCPQDACPEGNVRGYLGEVRLERRQEFLILRTAIGLHAGCVFDESAYLYVAGGNGRWQRFWQGEFGDSQSVPLTIHDLQVAVPARTERDSQQDRLVLLLGDRHGCTSAWHPIVYRLWRTNPAGTKLLLNESEAAYLGATDPPIRAALSSGELLVEFSVASVDPAVHHRPEIRRYRLCGDRPERIDPIALSPAGFVEQWLALPWTEASRWTNPRSPLAELHRQSRSLTAPVRFAHPVHTRQCVDPELRQVDLLIGEPAVFRHFLVQWRPPFRFRMVDVRDGEGAGFSIQSWPECRVEDPHANETRSLFPGFRPPA